MWVARERNGSLYLFNLRPWKPSTIAMQSLPFGLEGHWLASDSDQMIRIDDSLFPELTYDDEPIEVELIPKNFVDTIKSQMKLCGCKENSL